MAAHELSVRPARWRSFARIAQYDLTIVRMFRASEVGRSLGGRRAKMRRVKPVDIRVSRLQVIAVISTNPANRSLSGADE